ncbi:MAG: hypothetical protein KDK90_05345 [Leptospiraceae bacterium]|nr:hypothetical protein [Leptospiraceae bacterium]
MRIFITIVFILLLIVPLSGDDSVSILDAVGKYKFPDSESVKSAKQKATNNAKLDALKKAGVLEDISAFESLYRSETTGKGYSEAFSSLIQLQMRGATKNCTEQSNEEKKIYEGWREIEVRLKCNVVKFKDGPDAGFIAKVDGLKSSYKNRENLKFSIGISQDAYMIGFIINSERGFQLYPNDYEQSKMLSKEIGTDFPRREKVNYKLELNKNDKRNEHLLILVFLKEDIAYTGGNTSQSILEWIQLVPPNKKVIYNHPFFVYE